MGRLRTSSFQVIKREKPTLVRVREQAEMVKILLFVRASSLREADVIQPMLIGLLEKPGCLGQDARNEPARAGGGLNSVAQTLPKW